MSILDVSNLIQDTNILAYLSGQPQVQLSLQNIWKALWSNECTCDSEEEVGNQAPEHGIGDNDNQDQDQTDRENEERDGVQDQEQTLEIGNTTDFRQHKDDLDGIDGDFDDKPGTQRDKPDAQNSDTHDNFNNKLDNEAFDVLEHHQMKNGQCKAPSLTYLLRVKHTECRRASSQSKSPQRAVSTGSSALA
ncbi:hypothetical protein BDR05DRAFT_947290 [Suillus weaverae]|nr:hypothetical protein BDR05DRAFT_947290 [Suillus weaverae]